MKFFYAASLTMVAGIALASPAQPSAAPSLTATGPMTCTNAKTPKFNCPVKGHLNRPLIIGSESGIANLDACRDICLTHKSCISFYYNVAGGKCVQYAKDLPHMGLRKNKKQPGLYYNRACFKCSTAQATTSGVSSSAASDPASSTTSDMPVMMTSSAASSTTSDMPVMMTSSAASSTTSDMPVMTTSSASSSTTSDMPVMMTSSAASSTSSDMPVMMTSSSASAAPSNAGAAPPTCNNEGLEYAIYPNEQGDNTDATYSKFEPAIYQTMTPEDTATTTTIGGFGTSDQMTIYGGSYVFNGTYFVLNHRAYLYAPTAGTYTLNTGVNGSAIDDALFFWTGDSARHGYTRRNALSAQSFNTNYGISQSTFNVDQGYLPIRIMYAQAQGGGGFAMNITDPSGNPVLATNFQTTDLGNFVIQHGCHGETSDEAFPAFGDES